MYVSIIDTDIFMPLNRKWVNTGFIIIYREGNMWIFHFWGNAWC